MKRRLMTVISTLLIISLLATGCSTGNSSGSGDESSSKVKIEFWSAPNPSQHAFWTEMAKKYMKGHKNVEINVSQMPESPSSEAGIQSAIAAGNAPTASENITRLFGAKLSQNRAIVPLDEFKGYEELIKNRHMKETISSWAFADDHQYVLPLYSNSMLFAWRTDILKDLGYDQPPKTYSEVIEVGKKLKEKYPDKFLWARADLVKPTWWARWFDFFMLYNAASNGNNFIKGDKLVVDDEAGIKTLQFLDQLRQKELLLTRKVTTPFETGMTLMQDVGPWTFPTWKQKFPELKYNKNYTLAMPPVPDNVDPANAKTFADTKGISIYATATKEQQQAAFDFVKWVLSDESHDMKWFEKTNLPPARDDLATNEKFKKIFESSPQLKKYAENIPNAVPPIDNGDAVKIQEIIGREAVNPVVKQQKDPEEAWKDMKKAINGVLK